MSYFFAEKIVMTPKKPRVSNSTRLKIERKSFPVTPGSQRGGGSGQSNGAASSAAATPKGTKVHVAGGSYAGIVINKQQDDDDVGELSNLFFVTDVLLVLEIHDNPD